MNIRLRDELPLIGILSVLLVILVIFVPSNALRAILGLPFVAFFPGYCLLAIFFPRKRDISLLERVAISFGLSIAAFPVIGVIFYYTPLGFTLHASLYTLAFLICTMSTIAWWRRRKLPVEERAIINFHIPLPPYRRLMGREKVLDIVLAVAILLAITSVIYTVVFPKVGEKFTEFYLIGPESRGISYPIEMRVGDEAMMVVGIINREGKAVSYRVEPRIDGEEVGESWSVRLENGEKVEHEMFFSAPEAAGNKRVEFVLYEEDELHDSLYVWAHLRGEGEEFVEFYLAEYPREVAVNQLATVRVVIVNHNAEVAEWKVDVWESWTEEYRSGFSVKLAPEERYEGEINFRPPYPGKNQRLIFQLLEGGVGNPGVGELIGISSFWLNVE